MLYCNTAAAAFTAAGRARRRRWRRRRQRCDTIRDDDGSTRNIFTEPELMAGKGANAYGYLLTHAPRRTRCKQTNTRKTGGRNDEEINSAGAAAATTTTTAAVNNTSEKPTTTQLKMTTTRKSARSSGTNGNPVDPWHGLRRKFVIHFAQYPTHLRYSCYLGTFWHLSSSGPMRNLMKSSS